MEPFPLDKLYGQVPFDYVIKNLDLNSIVNLCQTNSSYSQICQRPKTWTDLLKRDYNVDYIPNDMMDPRQTYFMYKDVEMVPRNGVDDVPGVYWWTADMQRLMNYLVSHTPYRNQIDPNRNPYRMYNTKDSDIYNNFLWKAIDYIRNIYIYSRKWREYYQPLRVFFSLVTKLTRDLDPVIKRDTIEFMEHVYKYAPKYFPEVPEQYTQLTGSPWKDNRGLLRRTIQTGFNALYDSVIEWKDEGYDPLEEWVDRIPNEIMSNYVLYTSKALFANFMIFNPHGYIIHNFTATGINPLVGPPSIPFQYIQHF